MRSYQATESKKQQANQGKNTHAQIGEPEVAGYVIFQGCYTEIHSQYLNPRRIQNYKLIIEIICFNYKEVSTGDTAHFRKVNLFI